mgnify:CR=1 FL=1
MFVKIVMKLDTELGNIKLLQKKHMLDVLIVINNTLVLIKILLSIWLEILEQLIY